MARCADQQRGKGAVLKILRVAETGSTNADMLALAASGSAHEGSWLIAERQTGGRGRQGRAWQSPTGNLYASTLVELRDDDPSAPTLALVAGVAVIDAIGVSDLRLKWPNDVMAGGAKLGGILLERQGNAVVVGVGVNLAHAPELADRKTTSLAALGYDLSVSEASDLLAWHFMQQLSHWRQSGVAAMSIAWLERAHDIGTPLAAALPDGSRIDGSFDGLIPDGALQLRLADGTCRVIHAGDVFLI